jgi:hypothetical protein
MLELQQKPKVCRELINKSNVGPYITHIAVYEWDELQRKRVSIFGCVCCVAQYQMSEQLSTLYVPR